MAFRLITSAAPDLTTIRVIGRLRDDAVALLANTCDAARRPLVLDLSDLTSASEAGVLLLKRLAEVGVHLLGASQYVKLLLHHSVNPTSAPVAPQPRRARRQRGTAPRGRTRSRP